MTTTLGRVTTGLQSGRSAGPSSSDGGPEPGTGGQAQARLIDVFFAALRVAGRTKRSVLWLLALGVVSSAFAVLPPLAFGEVINATVSGLGGSSASGSSWLPGNVAGALVTFAVLIAASDGLRVLYGFSVTRYTNRLIIDLKRLLGSKALHGDDRMGRDRSSVAYLVNSDCAQLSSLYAVPMTTVLSDLIDSALVLLVVAAISWKLALILVVPAFPLYFVAKRAGSRQNLLARQARTTEAEFTEHIDHVTSAWLTIKVFGGQPLERITGQEVLERALAYNDNSNSGLASMMTKVSSIRLCASVAAVALAAHLASTGEIAIGSVTTLMLYLIRFYSPAINLSKSYQAIQRGVVSAQRIVSQLAHGDVVESAPPMGATQRRGSITLTGEGLSFMIPGKGSIQMPDFCVRRTGLVLITGPSGSGKSTILRSLIGVAPSPIAGAFLVDGEDIASWDQKSRLALFSYSDQDNTLLRGPITRSVVYPDAEAHDADARAAAALERVGLSGLADRVVGATELSVSGGEARRTVLARALARQAPILVGDEATSNLDRATRAIVERELIQESRRRVVLLAIHDPSTDLRDEADLIISLPVAES